jgi:deazaflavin-dependent oxidoreductase (nitroreductase family)
VTSAERAYFTPRGRLLAWITAVHRGLFQATRGRVGGTLVVTAEPGAPSPLRTMRVLLLTTVGRVSGLPRTVPLPYFELEGRRFLIASFAGGARHPAWYTNLEARPEVWIQMDRGRVPARAVPLAGDERARVWQRLATEWPRYQRYQEATSRTIPVVELLEVGPPRSP